MKNFNQDTIKTDNANTQNPEYENLDLLLNAIPSEFFNTKTISATRQSKIQIWLLGLTIFAIFLVCGYVLYHHIQKINFSPNINVYFEIKTIDNNGYPISGATVVHNGTKIGITDSFGEWRKFMSLKRGSTFKLDVIKKLDNKILTVSKNYAIPFKTNNNKAVEKISTIKLSNAHIKHTSDSSNHSNIQLVSQNINQQDINNKSISTIDNPESIQSINSQITNEKENITGNYNKINFEFENNSQLTSMSNPYEQQLKTSIIPMLRKKANSLGFQVDPQSEWKIILTNIVSATNENIIYVRSSNNSKIKTIPFLKNYISNVDILAQNILNSIRAHTIRYYRVFHYNQNWYLLIPDNEPNFWSTNLHQNKIIDTNNNIYTLSKVKPINNIKVLKLQSISSQEPCSKVQQKICFVRTLNAYEKPPKKGWKKFHIKIIPTKPNTIVFVKGYPALYIKNNIWTYWGKPLQQSNITIMQNTKILYRNNIKNIQNNFLNIPQAHIVKNSL